MLVGKETGIPTWHYEGRPSASRGSDPTPRRPARLDSGPAPPFCALKLSRKLASASISVLLAPLVSVVPLQIFALELATAKGYDVDQPRNLAKSVTVE